MSALEQRLESAARQDLPQNEAALQRLRSDLSDILGLLDNLKAQPTKSPAHDEKRAFDHRNPMSSSTVQNCEAILQSHTELKTMFEKISKEESSSSLQLSKLRASQAAAAQLQQQLVDEKAAHQQTLSELFALKEQKSTASNANHDAILQAQSIAHTSSLKQEVETLRTTVEQQRSKLMRLSKLLRSKVGTK